MNSHIKRGNMRYRPDIGTEIWTAGGCYYHTNTMK